MDAFLNSSVSLIKVGQGFCGTVWAESTDVDEATAALPLVIKRADGGPGRSLSHEQFMHSHILGATSKPDSADDNSHTGENIDSGNDSGSNSDNDGDNSIYNNSENNSKHYTLREEDVKVNIPLNLGFLEPSSELWSSSLLPRLPDNFAACQALLSERILPLPLAVRELLARQYSRGSEIEALKIAQDKSNESCLVRPYLGRRRPGHEASRRLRFFSLRNFPLHVDQMEALALPVADYARATANALAFLHWVAKVDAGDVEFVLAAARPDGSRRPCIVEGRDVVSEAFGRHGIFILDFDCCKELDMSEGGMLRAAMCFWRNDPFYPRPGAASSEDQQLWKIFEEQFLGRSMLLLENQGPAMKRLPGVLMRLIRENRDTWTKGVVGH